MPQIFRTAFSVTNNKYNTPSCWQLPLSKNLYKTQTTQYHISFRETYLWNSLVPTELKDLTFPIFKSKIKALCFGTTLRALIFAGIKCCGINFCGTNFCNFGPKSQKLVPQMFPNSSNHKNKFRKNFSFFSIAKINSKENL